MRREITDTELVALRKEISLCSLFIADYRNSLDIDPHDVCDFFDGYADYLGELMDEDGKDGGNTFFDHLAEYDTDDNLVAWFWCFDECPLMVDEFDE